MATDVKEAFDKLSTSISRQDAQDFHSTTLLDVRSAVRRIEEQQAQRQSLQNIRRVEPFLRFMENYARVIEVGCQGFSPMAWIWGPLKLMLQLASEYTNILEKLLEAYKQISEELPRIDRLRKTFGADDSFRKALGLIYADIVEFHGRAYKFFRRRAWRMVFECTWRNFENRFESILANLKRHSDLLDREAASIHFATAKEAALASQRQTEDIEMQRKRFEWKEVQQWLAVDDSQDTRLERLMHHFQPGSCEWMFRSANVLSWLAQDISKPIVWMKGNPGSGKSVACSQLVDHLQRQPTTQSAFYFCTYTLDGSDTCVDILRNIVAQLLLSQSDLVAYVYQFYVDKVRITSTKRVKTLLSEIISGLKNCRVVIDGIDECNTEQQKEIISSFLSLQEGASDSCKVLFSSRNDESHIKRLLSRKTIVELKGQTQSAISVYVDHRVIDLSQRFESLAEDLLIKIREQVCSKAQGMFLWVRLVFAELENQTTAQELADSLERLPPGLDEAYARILDRIRSGLGDSERRQAMAVLSWICCAMRPLRLREIEDGITFRPDRPRPKMKDRICRSIFDLCGPLIEELPDGSVDTVHFSAKEYLLHQHSGPFIDRAIAHQNVALSCIYYIESRVNIMSYSESHRTTHAIEDLILDSLNGLDAYSFQFWIDHVLACLSANHDVTDLIKLLSNVSSSWRQGKPSSTEGQRPSYNAALQYLECHPAALDLICQVLAFRKKLGAHESNPNSHTQSDDPTCLTNVEAQVSQATQRLLAIPTADLPSHLQLERLQRLKRLYNWLGFRCRKSGCRRATRLYKTNQERQAHEETHVRLYTCADCTSVPKGFKSAGALRKHRETYHMKPEDFEVPHSISLGNTNNSFYTPPQGSSAAISESTHLDNSDFGKRVEGNNVGNDLINLDPDVLPSDRKCEGLDWFAVFNPRIRRALDVDHVRTFVHESVVCCVRFSLDGQYLATGCNRSAQIFEVSTGRQICKLQHEPVDENGDLYIRSVCFSPDGKYLATSAEDKEIRVWGIEACTVRHTLTGHELDIYSLDYARNGKYIVSGSGDHTVRVWDLDIGRESLKLVMKDGVTSVAISPDGDLVAAGSLRHSDGGQGSVQVWDTRSGMLVDNLHSHKDSVYAVAFAPDGRSLISGSLDKTAKMWKLGTGHSNDADERKGRCIRTFEGHGDFVLSAAFTPDAKWVLTGSRDRGVQFWDPYTGNGHLMIQGHKDSVISVAPSPQGELFATSSGDMRARIWKYTDQYENEDFHREMLRVGKAVKRRKR